MDVHVHIVHHRAYPLSSLQSVLDTLALVEKQWGNMSDVAAIWLQDWTGQRVFGDNSGQDLPRVGLWWNWEVCVCAFPFMGYDN